MAGRALAILTTHALLSPPAFARKEATESPAGTTAGESQDPESEAGDESFQPAEPPSTTQREPRKNRTQEGQTQGQKGAARRVEEHEAAEPDPRLSDSAELDQIVELYMAGQYDRCTEELEVLLDPQADVPFRNAGVIERARLYYASCSILAGRREPARRALRAALEANPLMPAPDSLTFPPPVVSLFLEVRDEVQQLVAEREQEQLEEMQRKAEAAERRAEARRERERRLRELAARETVVARNSRVIASLPFGAGQFQNGNTSLGAALLVTEAVLAASSLTGTVYYSELRALGPDAGSQLNTPMNISYQVSLISSVALLSVTALGILEAHVSYKRERVLQVRKRELPKELRLREERAEDKGVKQLSPEEVDPVQGRMDRGKKGSEARPLRMAPQISFGASGAQVSIVGRF